MKREIVTQAHVKYEPGPLLSENLLRQKLSHSIKEKDGFYADYVEEMH
jgi:hypothetical protein